MSGTAATTAAAAAKSVRSTSARPLITIANLAAFTRELAVSLPAMASAESAFAIASLNRESLLIGSPKITSVPEMPLSGTPLQ